MVYFCPITGARIIAPGISVAAGGTVPEHDGSAAHEAAALACHAALNGSKLSSAERAPSADAVAKAQEMALMVATEPTAKPSADAQRVLPVQGAKPQKQGS